ncbi:MAG: hypothetical protein Q7R47_04110 [Candidatus Diapherotrites archaeon]|nr:hypothetical protein [Candidatus Diapherotrites archaeon]
MYPEQGGGAAEDAGPIESFRSRASNIESLIPIIIVLIIAVYAGAKFGFFSLPLPGLGDEPVRLLVVGDPSPALKAILDEDRDLVRYTIRDAGSLSVSPKDQLSQYKILLIDQSNSADKSVSRVFGDAVQDWVKTGGKLIVVKDSAIYRNGASDVIGWKATFGDIMPVECQYEKDYIAACARPIHVTAKIFQQDFKHKIMQGIEVAPADPDGVLFLETFNVVPIGNQIAYIQNVTTPAWYPAVVEKTWFGIGKVIYFNYDPGATKGIFENTLKYLR